MALRDPDGGDRPRRIADRISEAELYDGVARVQRGASDVPIWLHLGSEAGGPVLELGAGTGRVLAPLLDAGLNAYGLEWSEERLGLGRAKLAARGHSAERLIAGDARCWAAPWPAALVLATFNFLALFEDPEVLRVLRSARRNLRAGGTLAMEAQIWPPAEQNGYRWESREVAIAVGRDVARYREVVLQGQGGLLRVRRLFSFDDGSTRELVQDLWIRSVPSLRSLLTRAGFEVLPEILDERGRSPGPESRIVFMRATLA